MPLTDAAAASDGDLKHQHSFSDSGKVHVPMWDSSDPDRAPPPLPLNPGTPNNSPTKANTSATVAAAAQALVERARESLGASAYATPATLNTSPERPSRQTPQHKRLQSLQNVKTKDLRSSYENSLERQLSRSSSGMPYTDVFSSSPDTSTSRNGSSTSTPTGKDANKDLFGNRGSRPPPRPILGENTPPSSAMVALRSMSTREEEAEEKLPLRDVTNVTSPNILQKHAGSLESQLTNLTSIANALQHEMANLSRRSKDNAADLMSLKDATKTRDEDIRKSLRELISGPKVPDPDALGNVAKVDHSREHSASGISSRLLDNRPHVSPPPSKSISLPRIPPITGLEAEYERSSSPSPFSIDSTASVAMLEKVIRDMVTKDGHERSLATLADLLDRASKESSTTAKRVEELLHIIRDRQNDQKALVLHKEQRTSSNDDATYPQDNATSARFQGVTHRHAPAAASEIVTEELKKMVLKVKDSVTQSGGMTNEVKSLVRDLRAEVLGMGREIAGKLSKLETPGDNSISSDKDQKDDLALIIQDGLADLKEQMDQVIRSRRRYSTSSSATRNSVDSSEVYAVVKHALAEHGLDQTQALQQQGHTFDQEAILSAVREAYEAYKPEIELQQFGLERDEILQCLKEGLEDYQSERSNTEGTHLSKDVVLEAVQEGLQHFNPPQSPNDLAELKEDILMSVRECLEDFKGALKPTSWKAGDVSRDDILDAVKQGLGEHRKEGARELEIGKHDLFEAVRAGLDDPNASLGSSLLNSLHDIVDGMRVEFKQYSAANGRDTEQVLDALKDGLESLRMEIESYFDRAQDVTGKDEIVEALKIGLHDVHEKLEGVLAKTSLEANTQTNPDLESYIRTEFENLHAVIEDRSKDIFREGLKHDLVHAFAQEIQQLMTNVGSNYFTNGVAVEFRDTLNVEFEQCRDMILNCSLKQKNELLDVLRHGLADFQIGDGDGDGGFQSSQYVVSVLREELAALRETIGSSTDFRNATTTEQSTSTTLRESLDAIRLEFASDLANTALGDTNSLQKELEHLKDSFANALVPVKSTHDKEEIIEMISQSFQAIKGQGNVLDGQDGFGPIKEEIEQLRESIVTSIAESRVLEENKLEVIEAGVASLKSQMDSGLSFERSLPPDSVISELLNVGLDNLRIDLARMIDKPVDMTMSTEILDTLRNGLAEMRADTTLLRSGYANRDAEVVLADGADEPSTRKEPLPRDFVNKDDIQKLEVMLAQLQIKVEAIDQNMLATPDTTNQREDNPDKQQLASVEAALRELQIAVAQLSMQDVSRSNAVSKEDTEAIETLLYNTKAKIEEDVLPKLETTATKAEAESIESAIQDTKQSVTSISEQISDDVASKDDVAALAHLVDEAATVLKNIQHKFETDETQVTKGDMDLVSEICAGIRSRVDDLPSLEDLPSAADVNQLTGFLQDFRESHNILKDRYDADIEITAKAFDDRKDEARIIMDQINDLKDFVAAAKDDLKSGMKHGSDDVRALDEILQGIEDKMDDLPNAVADVRSLNDTMNQEFERAREAMESIRSAHENNAMTTSQSYETYSKAIIEDLTKQLDEKLGEVMNRQQAQLVKHEELKKVSQDMTHGLEARGMQQDDLLTESKAMIEELKITIDTLGASITSIDPALAEATEKFSDDAKTVFSKVEELTSKLDENNVNSQTDNQLTREEVAKCLSASSSMHDLMTDFQPKALDTLGKLLLMVEKHYEHSQKSHESACESLDRTYNHMTSSFASIPKIEGPSNLSRTIGEAGESQIRSKLDNILERIEASSTSSVQIESIEEIHQHVKESAAEISAFVEFQKKMITAEHENKEKEVYQSAMELSRSIAEKEALETTVTELRELKESLTTDINTMNAEREGLESTRTRLTGEVSSLETALKIRREELQQMDSRADALEQRILERVLDHSRAMSMGKAARKPANLSLKRVASNTSNSSVATTIPSAIKSATGAVLQAKSGRKIAAGQDPLARRIHSLSQITNNISRGGNGYSSKPRDVPVGLSNLKRSQSVKNPRARQLLFQNENSEPSQDKENEDSNDIGDIISEKSETDIDNALAKRTLSYKSSLSAGHARANKVSSGRRSLDSSVYALDSISNFNESEMSRTASASSYIRSNVGVVSSLENSIHEDDEDEEIVDTRQVEQSEPKHSTQQDFSHDPNLLQSFHEQGTDQAGGTSDVAKSGLVLRTDGYDSGLGSDLPTADVSVPGHSLDYFRSLNEL